MEAASAPLLPGIADARRFTRAITVSPANKGQRPYQIVDLDTYRYRGALFFFFFFLGGMGDTNDRPTIIQFPTLCSFPSVLFPRIWEFHVLDCASNRKRRSILAGRNSLGMGREGHCSTVTCVLDPIEIRTVFNTEN